MNPSILANPKADRIRHVADLAKGKARQRSGLMLVEGPQAVREAVVWAPEALSDLYVQAAPLGGDRWQVDSPTLSAIVDQAERQPSLYIHRASAAVMAKLSANAQGIVAVASIAALATTASAVTWSPAGTVAAFWQVRDPGNAGTVIRAADAAGCDAVVFVDECVDRFNPKVVRSTAGSLFHIPVLTMQSEELVDWCARRGSVLMAADIYGTPQRKPQMLPDMLADRQSLQSPNVVLFGNEARGLPQSLLTQVERIVAIPIYGKAESLNLATSAAVLLFSLAMSSHIGTM